MKEHIYSGVLLVFIGLTAFGVADVPEGIYFRGTELRRLKQQAEHAGQYLSEIESVADSLLSKGPWSITFFPGKAPSGDPHDYYSEGPYWWPDPENPGGPFIRRDGERNPARFIAHKKALNEMYFAVGYLSLAGYLFDDSRYSRRAAELLRVWYLDPQTRMNPNLNYGQAIPNKSPGRGVGIIDTHRWTKLVQFFGLLAKSQSWPEWEQRQLKKWFSDFLQWLNSSRNGLQEKQQGNNHTTWWAAQVAAYARFTGNKLIRQMAYRHAVEYIIPNQIEADGTFPKEEARTRSWSYVQFNLEAFALLCRLAETDGIDIWTAGKDDGGTVQKAIYAMVPFLESPQKWAYKQITKMTPGGRTFLYFAEQKFKDEKLLQLFVRLNKMRRRQSKKELRDPFLLICEMLSDKIDK